MTDLHVQRQLKFRSEGQAVEDIGYYLIGAVAAIALASIIGVTIFGCSYYQQFSFNSNGYYKLISDGYHISFFTAWFWSSVSCITLWTIGFLGWRLSQ